MTPLSTPQEPTFQTISQSQTINAVGGLTQGSPTNTPQPAAPTQAQLAIPSADDPFYSSPEFLQELDQIETVVRENICKKKLRDFTPPMVNLGISQKKIHKKHLLKHKLLSPPKN